jgi:hypothetical protein
VKPQTIAREVWDSVVEEVRQWPETIAVATSGVISDADGRYWEIPENGLGISFWPVKFDREYEDDDERRWLRGLTPPLTFVIDAQGVVTPYGPPGHPHMGHTLGSPESICTGDAYFHGNALVSAAQLHDWVVGTDLGPANSDWADDTSEWWHSPQAQLWFDRQASPKYIVAPYDRDYKVKAEVKDLATIEEARRMADSSESGNEELEDRNIYCSRCGDTCGNEYDYDDSIRCRDCQDLFCQDCVDICELCVEEDRWHDEGEGTRCRQCAKHHALYNDHEPEDEDEDEESSEGEPIDSSIS